MTYEYVCEACGHQWEAQQSIKDSPLKKCVSCGVDKAKRLVSGGTGFLLKGGGWYADLYGSPGSGAGKSEDKGTKSAAAKPDAAKPAAAESGGTKSDSGSGDKPAASSGAASGGSNTSTSTPTSTPAAS